MADHSEQYNPTNPGTPTNPNDVEIAPGRTLAQSKLHFRFARGGGPGGQHVNKVATKATLTVRLDDLAEILPDHAMRRLPWLAKTYLTDEALQITAADSKSQHANRKSCLNKLRGVVIQSLHRPKRRKPTRPSKRANQRRLDEKKRRGQQKARRGGKPDSTWD